MQPSKADSFSAFLEAKQRSKSSAAPSVGTALGLLNVLANADQQQMTLNDMMAGSGMSFPDFAEALKTLKDSGYLTLSGTAGAETAKLTGLGQDVTRLSRSK